MNDFRTLKQFGWSSRAIAAAAALGLAVAAAGSATAADQNRSAAGSGTVQQSTAAGPTLSIKDIATKLEEQGFTDISKIERERDGYEVDARTAEGVAVELDVDGQTGNVIRRERDN